MIYGYARVSTKGQDRYGNSLEVQERMLREAGAEVILRESFTGTKKDRPQLNKLFEMVQPGDTVIMTKLDRMARSTQDGLVIINALMEKNVKLHILNMGVFDKNPANKFMHTIFLAFAEFERDMIVSRTTEGKAVCRERDPNWREGRKAIVIPHIDEYLDRYDRGELTVTQCCKELGCSRGTFYRRIKEREDGAVAG